MSNSQPPTLAGKWPLPYYAVIFTSIRTDFNDGYDDMADRMLALAADQPGFLGVDSARNDVGITVSYWESLDAIAHWKRNASHRIAQETGRAQWYAAYNTRIAKVEREYDFSTDDNG